MRRKYSLKELNNQPLTRDEYLEIRYIGGKLEYMTLHVMTNSPSYWSLVSQADRDMATVADVHNGGGDVLEVGVGRAQQIWVVVPIEGKLSLARGGIFSFYEWTQPASDRLTDEKWQAMIRAGKNPPPPKWTKTFITGAKPHAPSSTKYEEFGAGG